MSEEARMLVESYGRDCASNPHMNGRNEAKAALLAYITRIERERDEARANYAFMVDRAAQREPTLDGYRELGAKCAQLEQKLDEARAENARLQAIVDEQAEDEGLWFVAETAPEAYLQQELRRLHAAIDAARKL